MELASLISPNGSLLSYSRSPSKALSTRTSTTSKVLGTDSSTPSLPTLPVTRPLPTQVTITHLETCHIRSLERINALLLPICYPPKFYTSLLSTTSPSLSLVALWRPDPSTDPKPIGGILARIQESTTSPSSSSSAPYTSHQPATTTNATAPIKELYILTLTLLAPYRRLGIASALLDALLAEAVEAHGVTSVFAHVWERNEDALRWYTRRGFVVEDGIVGGYYRRLRPGGARVVRKRIGVRELVRWCGTTATVETNSMGPASIGRQDIVEQDEEGS